MFVKKTLFHVFLNNCRFLTYYPRMASLSVSSRFAGLKIEDDDSPPISLQEKSKKVAKSTTKKSEPEKNTKGQPTKSQVG